MNKSQSFALVIALVVLAALAAGIYQVRRRTKQRASDLLAVHLSPQAKSGRQIQFVASAI